MKRFTDKEDAFIRANYLLIPAKRISAILERSESTARQRMKILGVVVPVEVVERLKRESRYKKGQVPANKGKKWEEFMSHEGMAGSRKTVFKKGTVPPNRRPVGSERICSKDGYVYVKVAEGIGQYRLKHRVIYEQHFGPIPKGSNVEFKDRDKTNFSLGNLVLRTRNENMKLNSYHNYGPEIAKAIQLRGALNRQINKHIKKIKK